MATKNEGVITHRVIRTITWVQFGETTTHKFSDGTRYYKAKFESRLHAVIFREWIMRRCRAKWSCGGVYYHNGKWSVSYWENESV